MFFHKKQPAPPAATHATTDTSVADLQHSVSWMEMVLANIAESICVINRDGSVKFANDAFAALVNEARIMLLGQPVWKFMYLTNKDNEPVGASAVEKAWGQNEHALDGTYTFNGKIVELTTQYVASIDQMVLVIRDISEAEQNRSQAADVLQHLQLEQTRMQETVAKDEAMLRSIGDAVIAIDKDARLILMNTSAERLFGVDSSKLIGKPAVDVLQFYDEKGNVVPPEQRMLLKALETGQRQGNEEEARSFYHLPDGTAIALALKITPVELKGNVIGAIGIYRDITRAREVDRMKTEFISLASHQLRTPLSSIKWYSEMLLNGDGGELNGDQLDFAKNISQSTDRMILLVTSLLNISRLESGRIIIDPKPTNLKELVDGVIKDLRTFIDDKNQTLIVSVHDNLPDIALDRRLVGQVYSNLLTNAIKYTPKDGEITVIISADGDNIISQITDNGLGIPEAQQKKLFEKFFRAENAVKVETDGNGLGLYLAKAIVASSGGRIWFKSEEGKGSTFWFSLPKSGMQAQEGEVMLETPHGVQ